MRWMIAVTVARFAQTAAAEPGWLRYQAPAGCPSATKFVESVRRQVAAIEGGHQIGVQLSGTTTRWSAVVSTTMSFRCFEFGSICDGDDPRAPGAKANCVPRDDSPYLRSPSEYVSFLQGLKSDSTNVMVADIVGGRDPVMVARRAGQTAARRPLRWQRGARRSVAAPALGARAVPGALRVLAHLRRRFRRQSLPHARRTAGVMTGSRSLIELPLDADPRTPGPRCRVFDVAGTERTPLSPCNTSSSGSCFELTPRPLNVATCHRSCGSTSTAWSRGPRTPTSLPSA